MKVAEKCRFHMQELPIPLSNTSITQTISLGVATSDGSEDIDRLVSRADSALYLAKEYGRNRAELAGPGQ